MNSPDDREARWTSWAELSKEQQCVLVNAAESALLLGVLADWEPALNWKERRPHVQRLADAAITLVKAGLVEVVERWTGVAEGDVLAESEAVQRLADPANWLGEDEDDIGGAVAESSVRYLELITTEDAEELLQTRGGAPLYGFREH